MPYACRNVTRSIEVRRIGNKVERKRSASTAECAELLSSGRRCNRAEPGQCALGLLTTPLADRCMQHQKIMASGERRRYSTCAVVGSGGSLHGSGCGNDINRHDMIIRMNEPVLAGFEADVGNRSMVHMPS